MSFELSQELKNDVRRGVNLIRLFSFAFVTPFVVAFLLGSDSVALKAGGVCLLLLSVFGVAYFFRLLPRARCPGCGWTFLRNPKGMGPADFIVSPACPRGTSHPFGLTFLPPYGVNQWRVQVFRAVKEKKIMCLRCGTDFDLRA